MYRKEAFLPDGREVMFEVHRKKECISSGEKEYELIGEYANMSELLEGGRTVGSGKVIEIIE